MPERILVAPPPGIDIDPLYEDRHTGSFGLTKWAVTVYERPDAAPDAPFVITKGGWGDPGAESCIPLAMQAADRFGRAAVVSNERIPSYNPLSLLAIIQTRKVRSQAVGEGIIIAKAYGSKEVVVAGQSHGGNNAIDGTLHAVRNTPKGERPRKLSVLTIDTPGVYGDLGRTESVHANLLKLVGCILQDLEDYPETGGWLKRRMLRRATGSISTLEALYFGSEFLSLLHIDNSGEIEELRSKKHKVPVDHVFHANDVVARLPDPKAKVYNGGHGAALVSPRHIVDHIASTLLPERIRRRHLAS